MIREIIIWLVAVPIALFLAILLICMLECARQERDPRNWRGRR